MQPQDVGWLAGLLDGEGSIVLVRGSSDRKSDGRRSVLPRIVVAVADFEILKKYTTLLSSLGINYGYVKQAHGRRHPIIHVWVAQHNSIVRLLTVVLPFLTLKARAARFVLDYTNWRITNHDNLCYRGGPILRAVQDKEQEFWETYQQVYMGKAVSHSRSLLDAVADKSVPLHWPD